MPYLTSGVLAFQKPTPQRVLELGAWVLEHCSPCVTYLVQLDGGRALAMCIESRSGDDGVEGDVRWLVSQKKLGELARKFKLPLWGGFAEGGYSNSQASLAVAAKGQRRWSSRWDFTFPPKVEAHGMYPLATPEDVEPFYAGVRAKNGYGRIGKELKADFYELLSIERGDPLITVPFLQFTEKTTAAQLKKWLAKYKPVKKTPVVPPADQLFVVFDGERKAPNDDLGMVVMLTAAACRERKLPAPQHAAFGSAASLVMTLRGPAVKTLSRIFQRNPFSTFLSEQREASVRVLSVKKGKVIASNGRANAMMRVIGGAPLSIPPTIEWLPLPSVPVAMLKRFDVAFHKWAKRKAREVGGPQVTVRSGFGLFG